MMLSTVSWKIEIYNAEIQNLKGDFKLEVEVNREELLSFKVPKCQKLLRKYKHLHRVTMDDEACSLNTKCIRMCKNKNKHKIMCEKARGTNGGVHYILMDNNVSK